MTPRRRARRLLGRTVVTALAIAALWQVCGGLARAFWLVVACVAVGYLLLGGVVVHAVIVDGRPVDDDEGEGDEDEDEDEDGLEGVPVETLREERVTFN